MMWYLCVVQINYSLYITQNLSKRVEVSIVYTFCFKDVISSRCNSSFQLRNTIVAAMLCATVGVINERHRITRYNLKVSFKALRVVTAPRSWAKFQPTILCK